MVQPSDRLADKPSTFSGGMKRLLNIAVALLHTPQVLILDKPTVGVDPQSRNAIFDSLEIRKHQDCALIYTSDCMEEVERSADHIVIIDHGVVIANESPATLYTRLLTQAAFRRTPNTPVPERKRDALHSMAAVASVKIEEDDLLIALTAAEHARDVMLWLTQQGCRASQFSTAPHQS